MKKVVKDIKTKGSNETITLNVKKLGINGEGIGYYKQKPVFIEGALPNETVEVSFTNEHDRYIYAKLIHINKRSPKRIRPVCKYFGRCGGCQLQHLDYDEQLAMKKELVVGALKKYIPNYKKLNIDIKDTIGMSDPYYYRNKAQMPTAFNGDQIVTGLYESGSHKLVYIDYCWVQHDLINQIMTKLKELLTREGIRSYFKKHDSGLVRNIMVRHSFYTDEAQVCLVFYKKDLKGVETVAKDLMKSFPQVKSFYVNINGNLKSHDLFGKQFIQVAGKKTIYAKIGDLTYKLSPRSFFQLNSEQTTVLYDLVKKAGAFSGTEKVIDAYCGAGTIGQYIASEVDSIRGMDITSSAIKDAKENMKLNRLKNCYYETGTAEKLVPKWVNEDGYIPDVLITDPPRTGIDQKLIDLLLKTPIKKIIYVSCNPSTLAKNLKELSHSYNIVSIQPLDMFPQTHHVESVVRLERK
ncbi:23S rRNA (uracil(1939)-C(5))-methyltransferase RlmD [Haloplasma contractile]|uniref:23S rRNA -methyltransferase RlmCD protein n=1 Tax=Haloplasma contractile SSD-17B TaxID=1033810 RepID=U2DXQ1_9MOLU|nr:23S rRNA (uracil(1939)-C(5))-methyltransferase RlmD [Haloplasma contractile]ERJ13027.1 23S rRNA -methyltransferase RlmCD protein [Haloplasma contractile SSD-17B]